LKISHPIDVTGMITGGTFTLAFDYNRYLFDENRIRELADGCRERLMEIIEHCSRKDEQEVTLSDLTDEEEISLDELDSIKQLIFSE